jgi:hypothetical protein
MSELPIALQPISFWRRLWWTPLLAGAPLVELIAKVLSHPLAPPPTIFYPGRALRIDAVAQLPDAPPPAPDPALVSAPDDPRPRLGRLWLQDGLAEQAAVAAFGQLALQLLRFGAPPELVAAAHAAALDELEHARLCFSLARGYGEAASSVAPFPAATAVDRELDLAQLMDESIIDGAFAEGFAANGLLCAAAQCEDAAVTEILRRLAREESRHAALAWDIAEWALRVAPAALRARLPQLLDRLLRLRLDFSAYPDDLLAHGRLDAANARWMFEATRAEVAERLRQMLRLKPC